MKKVISLIIILLVGLSFLEYYSKNTLKINSWYKSFKNGEALEKIQTQVFTPGGLRATIESKNSFLTLKGTIEKTNEQRVLFGKAPLVENTFLNQAALLKVQDMFKAQYFEHISPLGKGPSDLAKQVGYEFISVGENLALGNYKNDLELVEAWMNSPGHRANILNTQFTEIGVAVLKGEYEGKTTWLAVTEFGRPVSDCPVVENFLKQQIDVNSSEISILENQIKEIKTQLDNWPDVVSQPEIEEYNKKVEEYNSVIKVFNNRIDKQKEIVNRYNLQVKEFNNCIEK